MIHSMGLKLECNTRRFVTDDPRELQYRVEVQNRVYRKEVRKNEKFEWIFISPFFMISDGKSRRGNCQIRTNAREALVVDFIIAGLDDTAYQGNSPKSYITQL